MERRNLSQLCKFLVPLFTFYYNIVVEECRLQIVFNEKADRQKIGPIFQSRTMGEDIFLRTSESKKNITPTYIYMII